MFVSEREFSVNRWQSKRLIKWYALSSACPGTWVTAKDRTVRYSPSHTTNLISRDSSQLTWMNIQLGDMHGSGTPSINGTTESFSLPSYPKTSPHP
jgi:hypothetical protein